MLKINKLLILPILAMFLFNSCDDYCEFQFSEEFFPLEIGNTWIYSDYENIASYEKWEIVDTMIDAGIEKYQMVNSNLDGNIVAKGFFYFIGKKLYSTYPFYSEWEGKEHLLANFSLNKGDTYNLDIDDFRVIIISKKQNSITFGYMPNYTWRDFPDLWLTFEKGKGITEYHYHWSPGKVTLTDYLLY